ncbi:MAG: hypothetical protein WC455_29375 [Dehalococcoidia bacterium]|jgi:hypothetical protein
MFEWSGSGWCPETGVVDWAGNPYLDAGDTWDAWEVGDYFSFITYYISGESVSSITATIGGVAATTYSTYLGDYHYRIDFRYTENPDWDGIPLGDTVDLQVQIVCDSGTYTSGIGRVTVCEPASGPNPADEASDVSPGTTELYFTANTYDINSDTPFYGTLIRLAFVGQDPDDGVAVILRKKTSTSIGVFDISSVTLQEDTAYAWLIWTEAGLLDARSPIWHFTTGSSGLQKPTTPTPANGSGPGINFATRTVSWVDGGGAETYTVRMGTGGVAYNVVSLSQAGTSYTIPEGDISLYKDAEIAWRVDAEAAGETAQGDVWTFDPRPAKASSPTPSDEASGTALNLAALSWTKDAYTDTSEVNGSWSGSVSPISTSSNSITLANYTPLYMDRLGYSKTYTWSVGTTNEFGTTDGDDWTFDTLPMSRTVCSWSNYDGKTDGPGVENGDGVEGVDYYWTGNNCISTVKRVVAFASDRVWITEV